MKPRKGSLYERATFSVRRGTARACVQCAHVAVHVRRLDAERIRTVDLRAQLALDLVLLGALRDGVRCRAGRCRRRSWSDGTWSRGAMPPQRYVCHSLLSVRCRPRSAFGFRFAYAATSVTHGVGIMMLPELTAPLSSASKLAAFSECATPMSSACRMSSLASARMPEPLGDRARLSVRASTRRAGREGSSRRVAAWWLRAGVDGMLSPGRHRGETARRPNLVASDATSGQSSRSSPAERSVGHR